MSYLRAIPRDLFNEANLLKCYGQLYLNLEKLGLQSRLEHHDDRGYFQIRQEQASGGLTIDNVNLLGRDGNSVYLWRPLNSRQLWPLWLSPGGDADDIAVFDDSGEFSLDMIRFLKGE